LKAGGERGFISGVYDLFFSRKFKKAFQVNTLRNIYKVINIIDIKHLRVK
jgi:hypothetical protein